jgi:membrane-bound metal-dependent hydrolase YbcI (DUF457 family)
MLAINHAQLGLTCGLAYSLYTGHYFFLPLTLFLVFASIFPDIDHPGSELGKYFKPIGSILPHRGVTHSLVGLAGFGSLFYFLLRYDRVIASILALGALFGWNIFKKIIKQNLDIINNRSRIINDKHTNFLFATLTYIINTFLIIILFLIWKKEYGVDIYILLIIGYLAHLLGDFITIEGIPLFWPFRQKFGLKLFKTGSEIESLLGFVLFCTNIYFLYKTNEQLQFTNFDYWQKNISAIVG